MNLLRIVAVGAGLLLMVLGGILALGGPHPTKGAPSVLEFVLRPAGAGGATDGQAPWRLLAEGEQQTPEDVAFSIGFSVQQRGGRKSQNITELKAEVLPEPGRVSLSDDRNRGLALAHLGLIADEVERRTGRPPYSTAVRNLGEWVSADGGKQWWGWGLFMGGGVLAATARKSRRFIRDVDARPALRP